MAIVCPYCQKSMQMKGAKPGKFTPKCPKCSRPFSLVISADPDAPPKVTALPEPGAASPSIEKPVPPTRPIVKVPPPKPPPESEATGEFTANPDDEAGATTDFGTGVPASASPEETVDPTEAKPVTTPSTAAKASAKSPGKGKKRPAESEELPETLGGYKIVKQLGQGGMGAVYLARQLSLDRSVALKTMRPEWTSNATFVARFTREAYAAAQLVHHNIVQIYDIGSQDEVNFFSMEFVRGQSLGDLVKKEGKLDVEVAVGYILQAARGLKFCHDQGMIHRDVKPDNLMLNDQGVVKVADLGLVKTPSASEEEEKEEDEPVTIAQVARVDVTRAGSGMGTAAYMAPEQARSARDVDGRADIYSLGCTLYVLLTGRPPFQGASALEVITKHMTEAVPPPDVIVKRVPKEISAIILKMMAKNPDERFADMGEVVVALEEWLGVRTSGPFTPREEHADALEGHVKTFNSQGAVNLKSRIALGFFGGCILLVALCALVGMPLLAGGFLGLPLLTALASFLLGGILGKTYLFGKVRTLVFDSSWRDWAWWTFAALLFVLILYLFNLLWVWLGFCVVAILLAGAFWFVFDRRAAAKQAESLTQAEAMLRSMRLQGLEEEALRQFVCKYSDDNWEGFYEALFGFEAKLEAREKWGRGSGDRQRPRHGAWREPIIAWINAKLKQRRETRERLHLEAVERKSLQSKGLDAGQAKKQAAEAAAALVDRAAEIKREAEEAKRKPRPAAAPRRPMRSRDLVRRSQDDDVDKPWRGEKGFGLQGLFLGPKPRFLVGALLLTACALWMHQNNLIPGREIQQLATDVLDNKDIKDLSWLQRLSAANARPLRMPLVPDSWLKLLSGFGPGVAGLILVISALRRSVRISLIIIPAAILALIGPMLPLPSMGPLTPQTISLAGAGVLALAAMLLLRRL